MKRFKNTRIGKKVVPIDNSDQFNLITGKPTSLAGDAFQNLPQLVTIISEPYEMTLECFGKLYTGTFVTVLHNGEPHICRDCFYDSLPVAMDAHKEFMRSHLDDY